MIDDYFEKRKAQIEAKRKYLIDEENHYSRIARVFSSEDGYAVLEWILSDLLDFWAGNVASMDAAVIGKFDAGRTLFDQITLADPDIATRLIQGRRAIAESVRLEERKKIEEEAKTIG